MRSYIAFTPDDEVPRLAPSGGFAREVAERWESVEVLAGHQRRLGWPGCVGGRGRRFEQTPLFGGPGLAVSPVGEGTAEEHGELPGEEGVDLARGEVVNLHAGMLPDGNGFVTHAWRGRNAGCTGALPDRHVRHHSDLRHGGATAEG